MTSLNSHIIKCMNILYSGLVTWLVSGLVLSVRITYLASRGIIRPLRELIDQAAVLTGGNLTVTRPQEAADESRQLAEAFNRMATSLRAILAEIGQNAQALVTTSAGERHRRKTLLQDQDVRLSFSQPMRE